MEKGESLLTVVVDRQQFCSFAAAVSERAHRVHSHEQARPESSYHILLPQHLFVPRQHFLLPLACVPHSSKLLVQHTHLVKVHVAPVKERHLFLGGGERRESIHQQIHEINRSNQPRKMGSWGVRSVPCKQR